MNSFEIETADLSTEEGRQDFFFRNALDHRIWVDTEYQNGIQLADLPMFDYDQLEDWLAIHDLQHRAIAAALNQGVTPDIRTLDFEDDSVWTQWVKSHSQMHLLVNQQLGLL